MCITSPRLLNIQETLLTRKQHLNTYWLIAGLLAVVIALEFSTPPAYVFGYLYIGPILLANSRLSRAATFQITLIAAILTIANLMIPVHQPIEPSTIASRLIAVMALGVTGFLSDRRRALQEAIAQQQARLRSQEQLASIREDFVSTLTHDLKTPLLGAIETLKSLQNGQFGAITPIQQKVLSTMARSHRTTLQLVETLLDVYRNDAEGLKLDLAPIDLVAVAEDVIATLTDLAATRRVYINLSYSESDFRRCLWVNGDALQLQRVFANLLMNGINHSPRGGKVEVVLEVYSGYQVVKILDGGQGITEAELPYIFERFYQGYSDRHASGSGLGLYLTRQIIAAHDGTIWAENRTLQGALFGFRLPASAPQPSLAP